METARGLLSGARLVVAVLYELEAELALLEWEHRHPDLRLLGLVRDDVDELGHRLFFGDLLGNARHVVAREVAIDRLRGELALRDALDDRTRTHLDVAAGKHAGADGHQGAVRHDCLPPALGDALLAREGIEGRHLDDRRARS